MIDVCILYPNSACISHWMDKNCQQSDYMYTWNALTRARQSENVHPLYVTESEKVHPPKKRNQKNVHPLGKHHPIPVTNEHSLMYWIIRGGRVYFWKIRTPPIIWYTPMHFVASLISVHALPAYAYIRERSLFKWTPPAKSVGGVFEILTRKRGVFENFDAKKGGVFENFDANFDYVSK